MWILNFLNPEHMSREAGSRGPNGVGSGNAIASKLNLNFVPPLCGGGVDRQNPRLFDSLLLSQNTPRQYQREQADDASRERPVRRLCGHGLQGYIHVRWMPGEPGIEERRKFQPSDFLVIMISRIARAVPLDRSPSSDLR